MSLYVEAVLPSQTDLTLTLDVAPGQLMRLDTIAGVMSSFRDLQIAVGESLGAATEVFLAGLNVEGNRYSFTTRIVNTPASAMSASGQDPQGLEAKPASAVRDSGDAQ